jgi:hypothetical protein
VDSTPGKKVANTPVRKWPLTGVRKWTGGGKKVALAWIFNTVSLSALDLQALGSSSADDLKHR